MVTRPCVYVSRCQNPDIVSGRFGFTHEDADEPKLRMLRDQYDLDRVVGSGGEFDQQVGLRNWRATKFKHGFHVPPECGRLGPIRWDAMLFLQAAEMGASFACPVAAIVYVQLCLAMGWPARLVEIAKADTDGPSADGNSAHTVSEVWSNQFGKWILMDSDCNCHYSRDGVPLSALEVREAWITGDAEAVALEQGRPDNRDWDVRGLDSRYDSKQMHVDFFRHRIMDYYHTVRVTLRNNHLSQPLWPGGGGDIGFLPQVEWVDALAKPKLMWNGTVRPGVYYSGRRDDLEWRHNQVNVQLACETYGDPFKPGLLWRVTLDSVTPWFSHYEVGIDGGAWRRVPASFVWPLHVGCNQLQARSHNRMGRAGAGSVIHLEVVGR